MKGLSIYYLEDVKDDFNLIKKEFLNKGVKVYPLNEEERASDLDLILKYLKSNEEEKKPLSDAMSKIFLSKNLDLLIFDFYLKGTELNSGVLFNEIIKNNDAFADLPVIFLSIEARKEFFNIDNNSSYALKESKIKLENTHEIYNRIEKEALKFPVILHKLKRENNSTDTRINWIKENF